MNHTAIRPAEKSDLPALHAALTGLSADLGDEHRATRKDLEHALFGPSPVAWAQVIGGSDELLGLVLFSPVLSTVRGGAGIYVSDLWVSAAERGRGLGSALLKHAAGHANALWGCTFIRLAVYDHNPKARALYDRLGFVPSAGETVMVLAGQPFQNLWRDP